MEPTKRKKYFIFGNLVYVIKRMAGWDKSSVLFMLFNSPVTVIGSLAGTTFAPAVYYVIEQQMGFSFLLLTVAVFSALLLLVSFLSYLFRKAAAVKQMQNHERFQILLVEKLMTLDYELLEGPVGRLFYQKAKNALDSNGIYVFLDAFFQTLTALMGFGSFSVIIGRLSPWLILAIILVQLLGMSAMLLGGVLVNAMRNQRAETDRKLAYIAKNARDFQIAKDVRLYSMRDCLRYLEETFISQKAAQERKVDILYKVTDLVSVVFSLLIRVGAYAYLIYRIVKADTLSGAEITLYLVSMVSFGEWVGELAKSISSFFDCNLRIRNFREFMDLENSTRQAGGKPLPTQTPYEITVDHVSFIYPGSETKTLDDVSLRIAPGEHVALVGVNGAGKTTLVKILCGLYSPTEGRILLNGTDIADLNRDEYYQVVSAVFQDARVMPLSILENISGQSREQTDLQKLENCIRFAGLEDKLKTLENGVDTLLGKSLYENGTELSGGERQKLFLARALYKDAPVLILDEPTAALDPLAEHQLYMQYDSLSAGKTTVFISHRLSSTRFCDRIIFLDGAKVAETGTHEQLMERQGKYAEMFRIQSKYYEQEVPADV